MFFMSETENAKWHTGGGTTKCRWSTKCMFSIFQFLNSLEVILKTILKQAASKSTDNWIPTFT